MRIKMMNIIKIYIKVILSKLMLLLKTLNQLQKNIVIICKLNIEYGGCKFRVQMDHKLYRNDNSFNIIRSSAPSCSRFEEYDYMNPAVIVNQIHTCNEKCQGSASPVKGRGL